MSERILFLDDSEYRIDDFSARFPHAVICRTADECIALLESGDWDEVHLDHDLGGESWVDSEREDTGMEVVRYMALNTLNVRTVIVHSHNTIAAPVMVQALESAGYYAIRAPFRYANGGWYYGQRAVDNPDILDAESYATPDAEA